MKTGTLLDEGVDDEDVATEDELGALEEETVTEDDNAAAEAAWLDDEAAEAATLDEAMLDEADIGCWIVRSNGPVTTGPLELDSPVVASV